MLAVGLGSAGISTDYVLKSPRAVLRKVWKLLTIQFRKREGNPIDKLLKL